nr:serine/threonine-protein phosphatase 7 long form like [Quercus suber]
MEPRIDEEPQMLEPGPRIRSLLTRQSHHRSEDIWNGEDSGALTCRGRTKEMANIQMRDDRYWAWARLPFLCPRIEPPPGSDYGPWPYAPLAVKWVRVPGSKSRPSGMALVYYREQLVTMQPNQIVWQPYEAHFAHLPDFCVAGRGTWTARVPLVCFCIVEAHHPDRVLRQFGLAQERPDHVVEQRVCRAPPQTGEMARNHDYYQWYRPVTRKYIDRNSARLHQMIESHLALLNWLPVGSREHNHVRRILYNVAGLGGDPTATGQATNRTVTESATTAAPSTSAAPVTTPTRGRRDTASPSTSTARGRGRLATASPSTSTARGRGRPVTASLSPTAARGSGRPATASPSTSAARGRGRCATTPRVVSSPEIPAPIPHASPQSEVPPPIPVASPQSEVPPPMVDVSPQAEVPSPTPPSQPSPSTPPMHPETPLHPPTSSSALTLPMDPPSIEPMTMIPTPGLYIEHHDPPTSSLSDPLGPPDTKAALCTMMSLRLMPRSLLPRPNIARGLKNAKLVNIEKEVTRAGCFLRFAECTGGAGC